MTTIKTPLPTKFTFPDEEVKIAINEIITYLTELTAVVEGKQSEYAQTFGEGYATGEYEVRLSLKEQLLGEIADMRKTVICGKSSSNTLIGAVLDDVEAIINRILK